MADVVEEAAQRSAERIGVSHGQARLSAERFRLREDRGEHLRIERMRPEAVRGVKR